MLGELIAQLDRPDVAKRVMATLHFDIVRQIERRATTASMSVADFVAGAVREFLESADDDLWFQLLTIVRRSDDPGLTAVKTILTWVSPNDRQLTTLDEAERQSLEEGEG